MSKIHPFWVAIPLIWIASVTMLVASSSVILLLDGVRNLILEMVVTPFLLLSVVWIPLIVILVTVKYRKEARHWEFLFLVVTESFGILVVFGLYLAEFVRRIPLDFPTQMVANVGGFWWQPGLIGGGILLIYAFMYWMTIPGVDDEVTYRLFCKH